MRAPNQKEEKTKKWQSGGVEWRTTERHKTGRKQITPIATAAHLPTVAAEVL